MKNKLIILVALVITILFSGCFNKNITTANNSITNNSITNNSITNNNKNKTFIDIYSSKKALNKKALDLRYKLYNNNGLDFIPWPENINDNILLMEYLSNNLKTKELTNYTRGYKITSIRGKTYISDEDGYIYVHYKTKVSTLKNYLKSTKKIFSSYVKKKSVFHSKKEVKSNFQETYKKGIDKKDVKPEKNRKINFQARGVQNELTLLDLLYTISYNDCSKIYHYRVFPMLNYKMMVDDKYKRMEIDIRSTEKEIIKNCK